MSTVKAMWQHNLWPYKIFLNSLFMENDFEQFGVYDYDQHLVDNAEMNQYDEFQ